MSINVPAGSTLQVRLRFTDGNNRYSRIFTYGNVSIEEGDSSDPLVTLPLSDPMDGSPLVGGMHGITQYFPDPQYVVLTPDTWEVYGVVGYRCDLPSRFRVTFDFKYTSASEEPADAVYPTSEPKAPTS